MGKTKGLIPAEKLSEIVVHGMQEKKASDIVVMDLRNVANSAADFFVICSGNSDTQVEAISDSIEKQVLTEISESPWHVEGRTNLEWVLLDYIDVVAHVFKRDSREFYSLENLWGDATSVAIAEAG